MGTHWYVYTDAFTNESLARELAQAGITEESATEVLYDERKIRVWDVPFRFATMLKKNRKTFPFAFTIFVQEGGGEVRKWNLQRQRKLGRRNPLRETARALELLKEKSHPD